MIQHKSPISGIAAFEDRYVATAGYDNQVILWDARTKTALARSFHDHLANQCRFSPDGRMLVTASSDYTARLWSVPDLKLLAVLSPHADDVEMAAFNPQGDLIATASRDHKIRIFELSGRLKHELVGHRADVISVEWSSDGRELLSSSDDGTIRRWDPAAGRLLGSVDLMGVETDTVVCAPDGTIFAGNDEGEIVVIAKGRSSSVRVRAHQSGVKRLALDPKRGLLVSLSYDRTMKVYRLVSGDLSRERQTELPAAVWPRSCAFLGDSKLVFGTFGSSYAVYDLDTERWTLDKIEETPGINAVLDYDGDQITVGDAGVVCRNGRPLSRLGSLCNFLLRFGDKVITGGQSGEVFEALSGQVLYRHKSPLNCGAYFIRAGRPHFILGAYTGEGLVFKQAEGGEIVFDRALRLHPNAVKGLACDASRIFSVCATGAAAFHSTEDFRPLFREEKAHEKISNACDALAGGVFSSVSRDLKLRLWDERGLRVVSTPHTHSIKCVRAQRDGRHLALGSYDGWVHVYDALKGDWVRSARPTTAGISSLSAAHDGRAFLASSYDGAVYKI